jgi:hypothetical protein
VSGIEAGDLILFGDLDELPRAEVVRRLKGCGGWEGGLGEIKPGFVCLRLSFWHWSYEFIFSANILSPEGHKSTSLNQGEFILLNFMRLGIVSGEQIEQFSEQFRELDTAKRGVLELEDLQKIGVVVERDHTALDSPLPQNNSPPTAFISRIEEVEVAVEEEEVHSYNTNNDL